MPYARKAPARPKKAYKPRKTIKKTYNTPQFASAVRKVVLKTAESKHKDYNYSKTELYHNVVNWWEINDKTSTLFPVEGTGDDERIGDQINLSGFSFKFLFGQKGDRPNVTWRMAVVEVPQDYTYSYATLFDSVTGNTMLDSINSDGVKVLHQKWFKPMNIITYGQAGGDEYTFVRKLWIPRKKLLKFQNNNSSLHNDKKLLLCIAPYDAYGSLVSDNIAYAQFWQRTYYKDP